MAVPAFDQFIEPLLRYLGEHPGGIGTSDAYEAMARTLDLSDPQRLELLPSGTQPIYKNRVGWAHDRLKRHGYSESPRRGHWQITRVGLDYLKGHPNPLSPEQREALATADRDSRARSTGDVIDDGLSTSPATATDLHAKSPDDRLQEALDELNEAVALELLEAIGSSSPGFFEVLVLDLLHAIGYGKGRGDLKRVGGSGDGGIDGVISLDRLGLEKVYVQAKRWKGSVGRPEIQGFYGALAGQRATKGAFITTSSFTSQATEFAASVERIVLIDGERLAQLMIEHGVAVSHRQLRVAKLDNDYFEE